MPRLVKAGETTPEKKRMYFYCVDATDGITPEPGEEGGQPQISINGGAFTNSGIGTLSAVLAAGTGWYYAELTDATVSTAGRLVEGRYKSANTAEAFARDAVQVVAFDPDAVAGLGLTNLDAQVSTRSTLTAQQVWEYSARTLTSFGNLVADTAAAVWAVLTSTLTGAGTVGKRIVDYLDAAVSGRASSAEVADGFAEIKGEEFSPATDTLEKIRDAIGALSVGAGSGAYIWDLTLTDKGNAVVPYCPVVVRDNMETAVLAAGTTTADGKLALQLDEGRYKVRFGPKPGYDFTQLTDGTKAAHPWVLVISGDTSTTLKCNRISEYFEGYSFADLKRAVLHPLELQYKRRVVESQLELWIRAGDSQVNARLRWHRSKFATASAVSQPNYVVWTQPKDIVAVTYDGVPLMEVSHRQYLDYLSQDNSEGTPERYSQWGNEIYLYPTPGESGKPIEVWALDPPPLLSADDDTPSYPPEYHRAIVEWALYLAYTDLGVPDHAAVHLQAFESQMAVAVLTEHSRGLGSRMEVFEG